MHSEETLQKELDEMSAEFGKRALSRHQEWSDSAHCPVSMLDDDEDDEGDDMPSGMLQFPRYIAAV